MSAPAQSKHQRNSSAAASASSMSARDGYQTDTGDGTESGTDSSRKKSVEDLLNGTQEIIGNSINQALTFTNTTILTASPVLPRKRDSTSPSASPRASPKIFSRQQQQQTQDKEKDEIQAASSKEKENQLEQQQSQNASSGREQQQQPIKSDSHTSININVDKCDGNNAEDSISKSSDSSQQTSSDASKSLGECDKPKNASKISERAKKKSWYSVLYPSYKSRSEDFKKLFKDVPDDERLVVDYSCALQRDILVHGRLYVSQNYICFYANIFRWETCLSIRWKDVTAISKEKTALVIPNAISVCTESEKHFLTSFTTRDKAFLMLFRVWQNALMDKPMQPQEMWQWVHNCYGDELGLTSDDEDYIDPSVANKDEDQISINQLPYILAKNKSTESFSDTGANDTHSDTTAKLKEMPEKLENIKHKGKSAIEDKDKVKIEGKRKSTAKNSRQRDHEHQHLPTDISDSSDSEHHKNIPFVSTAECTSMHEGRQLVHTILPINIDNLFNLLFSKSKFLVDFHTAKKSTDLLPGEWAINEDGVKERTVNVTVALAQSVGPKSSHVTETQLMRDCSQPGQLYSVDISSVNAGIPYADSFCVLLHYCLVKTVDDHTMLSVHAQIKYKKSIWGVVKGFIEKNTWAGLEDFFTALLRALQNEVCIPPAKGKGRRPRRGTALLQRPFEEASSASTQPEVTKTILPSPIKKVLAQPPTKYKMISWIVISLLIVLIFLNVILLFKLWSVESKALLENQQKQQPPNLDIFKDLPKNHDDWIKLLKQQEALHESEMRKWHQVLETAIELLRKTEKTLTLFNNNNAETNHHPQKEDDQPQHFNSFFTSSTNPSGALRD